MKRLLPIYICTLALILATPCFSQDLAINGGQSTQVTEDIPTNTTQEPALQENNFYPQIRKAVFAARKKGLINRAQALRLQIALLSPAFRKRAEDLAITQLYFQTEEELPAQAFPVNEDGSVDRPRIDWEEFAAFLERIVPLILKIIEFISQLSIHVPVGDDVFQIDAQNSDGHTTINVRRVA